MNDPWTSPCGRIRVRKAAGAYIAQLGAKDASYATWTATGRTRPEAVRRVVKMAKDELKQFDATLNGL